LQKVNVWWLVDRFWLFLAQLFFCLLLCFDGFLCFHLCFFWRLFDDYLMFFLVVFDRLWLFFFFCCGIAF
jgi:hypothetical protein